MHVQGIFCPLIPDKSWEVTVEEGMINTFRSLLKDWAAPFITDSPDANSFHGGETIDTSSPSKNLIDNW